MIQSAWAVGWGLAAVAFTAVFSLADPELAWRILFWLGILPALLILYIRARVEEPRVWVETNRARLGRTREALERGATASPLVQIFRRDLLGTTAAASLLSIGAQGATTPSSSGSPPSWRASATWRWWAPAPTWPW